MRDATRSDVDAMVAIIGAHEPIDGDQAANYYDAYFGTPERLASERERAYVVVDHDVIVGVCGYMPDKYNWTEVLWLTWLYVAESFRRRGIAWQMLDRIATEASDLGARKLYLDTSSDDSYAPAIALYRRFGFAEEGRLLDYYGPGEDMVIMGLALG